MGTITKMNDRTTWTWHREVADVIEAPVEQVFAFLDDPARLTAHMENSSWMMGGGKMNLAFDDGLGRRVGSAMKLAGRAFGLPLSLDEVVTERSPPYRKVWQTVGAPRLWVIAHYRLGFEIDERARGSMMRVFIDYELPTRGFSRWLGRLFGAGYAKWCTSRMLGDARTHFAHGEAPDPQTTR